MLNKRKVEDLRRFLAQSESLSKTNYSLTYLFITLYGIGLFISAYATSTNDMTMNWVGLAINIFAQIIYATEKVNNAMLKQLQSDIGAIKDGTYVEQGPTAGIIDVLSSSVQTVGFTPVSSVTKEVSHLDTTGATMVDTKSK